MINFQKLSFLKLSNLILFSAVVILVELLPQLPLQSSPKLPPTGDRRPFDGETVGGGTRWRNSNRTDSKNIIYESAEPIGGAAITGRRMALSACNQQNQTPLTALMPNNNNNVAITVAAHPSFFLYVPKTNVQSSQGEFILVDEQQNEIYKTKLVLTDNPGIINLSLPTTTALEVGKTYHWQFTLICNPQDPSNDDVEFVKGAIKRTELSADIKNNIAQAAPLEQAKFYVDAGIWHETVAILSMLRDSRPNEWSEFLKSVELDAIAQAPFVEYVYTNEPKDTYAF